jgi:hypothetical protein
VAAHLFLETNFERAGDYFVRGKIDPRLLVRLFPLFRGKVIGSAEEVEVYEGLRAVLTGMGPVDEIGEWSGTYARTKLMVSVSDSIRRNYQKDGADGNLSEERGLADALDDTSKAMLTDFLRKTRASRRKGGGARGVDSRKIDIVCTVLLVREWC